MVQLYPSPHGSVGEINRPTEPWLELRRPRASQAIAFLFHTRVKLGGIRVCTMQGNHGGVYTSSRPFDLQNVTKMKNLCGAQLTFPGWVPHSSPLGQVGFSPYSGSRDLNRNKFQDSTMLSGVSITLCFFSQPLSL